MKKIIIIAFVLVALCAQGATKVKTQHFEIADSVRLFDKDEPDGVGYKLTRTVTANWPVSVNGKKCNSLNKYLLEALFHVEYYSDDFPYFPEDMDTMVGFLRKVEGSKIRENTVDDEFIIKEVGGPGVPEINCMEEPLNCWFEIFDIDYSHSVGDLAFFTAYFEDYHGGAHGMFFTGYLPYDIRLDKPISLTDIVTNPAKLLPMLPAYDKRDEDSKWWQNVEDVDLNNFYIKNGKIVFSFSPYTVGPFCDGQVEVAVPLKKLKSKGLLTTYGKTFK